MDKQMPPGSFRPKSPFHMVWLATNLCNARCAHCSSNSSKRYDNELTTEEACDLMDEIAAAGVVDLAISGGEPLLRRDLIEVIKHARSRALTVGVGSNGAGLSRRKAADLASSGINRFQVSLDGTASVHDKLRRWDGLFNRVLRTIETAKKAGLRIHVCCTINRLNWQSLEPFTKFVSKLGISRLNFSRYVPTGRGNEALDLSPEEWRSVVFLCNELKQRYEGQLEIVTHLAQQILVDEQVRDMPGFIGCQAGIGQGAVTSTGMVLPCVLLPIRVGNIRDKPFDELWRASSVIRALQSRAHLKGQCTNCEVRSRCGGCRAVAYAKTGDYLAGDPRCWVGQDVNNAIDCNEKETCHV